MPVHTISPPPSETLSLAALHQDLTNLFPPLPSSSISSIQQILPRLYATTQRIHLPTPANPTPAAPEQPVANPTVTLMEQRVGPFPITHDVQRVASPLSPDKDLTSCPTLISFSTLSPPGRTALPPGGDNISYTRSKLRTASSPRMGSTATPRDQSPVPRIPLVLPCPVNTHVGKWQVKRVIQHRARDTHRTKLQFCVQWEPNDGIVSPDTWLPWDQARRLDATSLYIQTIPRLQ
jgi:hypothetical protein